MNLQRVNESSNLTMSGVLMCSPYPPPKVRGLVRSAAKAQEKLSCGECTTADGIFVGDVTKPDTLVDAMDGVKQLVILTCNQPLSYCCSDRLRRCVITWRILIAHED